MCQIFHLNILKYNTPREKLIKFAKNVSLKSLFKLYFLKQIFIHKHSNITIKSSVIKMLIAF